MSAREPTAVVFARYLVYQVPGFVLAAAVLVVLVHWELVGVGLAWLLFGFWVLKDLVLFPITRVGYERGVDRHGVAALVGSEGVAQEDLREGAVGWVRVGPELWRARLCDGAAPVEKGAAVHVVAVEDLVLRVERAGP